MKTVAAGLALVLPDGMALFLKRAPGHDYPGTWCFPGGMLETNEPPLIGAIRETREETSYIAPEDAPEPTLINDGRYATFKQRVGSQFIPTLDNENIGWAWAPLDAPPEPLHPGVKDTLVLIAKDNAMPVMMATTPNAGMPAFAGARKKLKEAADGAEDMTPEKWRDFVGGLLEFFAEEAGEPEHAEDALTGKETAEGKLTEKDKGQIGRVGSEHREEMPAGAFLMPASRKYPVKEKQGGDWAYSRKLLLAAAREARMHGHESLAVRADAIRKREFAGAQDEWNEGDHPRDESGEFSFTGGGKTIPSRPDAFHGSGQAFEGGKYGGKKDPLYLTTKPAEAAGFAKGEHLGGEGGSPQAAQLPINAGESSQDRRRALNGDGEWRRSRRRSQHSHQGRIGKGRV